jgi:IS5 family transposase
MALGALIMKARMGLMDEELVEQIKQNPYFQFFIGPLSPILHWHGPLEYSAPFHPSMVVYFRKRLTESVVNDCNERIVHHGLSVISSSATDDHDNNNSHGSGTNPAGDQQVEPETTGPNQTSLLIGATCVPADIRYLTV